MSHPDIDYDHIGAYLFETTVDPEQMIDEGDPYDGLAEAPPPISGYRMANVAGMACWNCGHFTAVDDADGDGVPDGICNLFEARAEGECTCDRFTAHPDLYRQSPHTSWAEDMANEAVDRARFGPSVESVNYSDSARLNEINFSSVEAAEEDGLVWKDILRTGEWSSMPTDKGILKKKLRVIDEGESDPLNGVISLSELEENFNEGAIPYVTVPLSDDKTDHKNIARLNTGLVKKLKRVTRDGVTYLRAGIHFTEPEVKEKVLRGTIPDVSAGVPFGVTRRKDNKFFRTVLDHVCLTRKPFIEGLGPFGLAAADSDATLEVEAWEEEEIGVSADTTRPPEREDNPTGSDSNTPESETQPAAHEQPPAEPLALSFREQEAAIRRALGDQLRLSIADYLVEDISTGVVVIRHRTANVVWDVPFKLTDDSEKPVKLATVEKWKIREGEAAPTTVAASSDDELRNAHELRELRLAQPTATGGIQMSVTAPLSLEGIELSDEARQRIQGILAENEELKRTTRESQVNDRIAALEALGLKERPGALKFYRQVMLSDDGGPAIILFSDSDDPEKKERLTALEVLDRFIEALKGDGGVQFSDQALKSGNDSKPPLTAEGEKADIDQRVKEANRALYGNESGPMRRHRHATTK